MSWSIVEVARMSGVTSRTLRHYDAIGLLTQARVAANGWCHYEQQQLLRLQQILLLRNLGLGLRAVAEVLDRDSRDGTVAVLRRHRRWLMERRPRPGAGGDRPLVVRQRQRRRPAAADGSGGHGPRRPGRR